MTLEELVNDKGHLFPCDYWRNIKSRPIKRFNSQPINVINVSQNEKGIIFIRKKFPRTNSILSNKEDIKYIYNMAPKDAKYYMRGYDFTGILEEYSTNFLDGLFTKDEMDFLLKASRPIKDKEFIIPIKYYK